MDIKKIVFYILIILLLISLFFFICNKKYGCYDGDSSGISDSETGQIGYMKDVTPETGEDGLTSTQSGAEYKQAANNQGRTYKDDTKYKEDRKDLKVADEKKEASVKPVISGEETKSPVNKITAKDKTDTKKSLNQEKAGEVKVAKKTDKGESIKSADAVKADEKTVIAKNTVADKAVSSEKTPVDSDTKKVKDKEKVSEDSARVRDKENIPLKEEKIAANEEVKTPKQEDKKSNANINDKSSRMDKVHLYSGKVLTGTVAERGEVYTIITTEGKEKVSKTEIQGNEIIK